MSLLDTIVTPQIKITIPSTKTEIDGRPFLVKEEKVLMMALETGDEPTIVNAVKTIIGNCTFGKVDPNTLTIFDIEYLYLQLRAKSKGELLDLSVRCTNRIINADGVRIECGTAVPVAIDLNEVRVETPLTHNNIIELDPDTTVKMKYPPGPTSFVNRYYFADKVNLQRTFDSIIACLDIIYHKNEQYNARTIPKEELEVWLEALQSQQLEKLADFFFTMPALRTVAPFECPTCGYKDIVMLEGLKSFLG